MRILISAGPMRTYIDPIRYIQNSSSGVLALEITCALKTAYPHAEIVSLLGPVDSEVAKRFSECSHVYPYRTPDDYGALLLTEFKRCDLFVSAAAVLDFEIQTQPNKIARRDLESRTTLELPKANVRDFAAWVGNEYKTDRQKILAFSLDTDNEASAILRGADKVTAKNADWIFVNFANSTQGPEKLLSEGVILNASGDIALRLPESEKRTIAKRIVNFLVSELTPEET